MAILVYTLIFLFMAILLLGFIGKAFESLPNRKRSLIGGIALGLFLLYLAGGVGYAIINGFINPPPPIDWDWAAPEPDCPGAPYVTC